MMLFPLCTRQACQPGWGMGWAAERAEGTYLCQKGGDEDEKDIVDEEYQQQQRAGLQKPGAAPMTCGARTNGPTGRGLLLCSEPSTLDPFICTQSSDLHPGLPAMLRGSLTLKVGRRMVFSMYRQKAMPRTSCRTQAHLGEKWSITWSSACLILHQVATAGLPSNHELHPPCPQWASDPRSGSITKR